MCDYPPAKEIGIRQAVLPHTLKSGMLLASAAVPVAILRGSTSALLGVPTWLLVLVVFDSLLLLVSALTITRFHRLGQICATLSVLGGVGIASPLLVENPLTAMVVLVAVTTSLALLWDVGTSLLHFSGRRFRPLFEGQTQGASIAAVSIWLCWTLAEFGQSQLDIVVVGVAMIVCLIFGIEWSVRRRRTHPGSSVIGFVALASASICALLMHNDLWWVISSFLAVAGTSSALARRRAPVEVEQGSWWEPIWGHPDRLFVGTFAGLSLFGMFMLALPQCSATGHGIGLLDSLFTSVSAVCVTGLTVRDTSSDFTVAGQLVILFLIQIGGIGIMTFSTTLLWAVGRRVSLRHEGVVARLMRVQDRRHLFATATRILKITVFVELGGAIVLTAAFLAQGDPVLSSVWRGIFTSISAFCNAGFALQSDSLIQYQHSPFVLHAVGVLIILGGLSPLAICALPALVKRTNTPISAQAKLSLAAAVCFLLVGFLYMLAFEWNNTLAGMPLVDRIHNAWFQSVTLRTAGFNSIDISGLHSCTITLMMLWMFIGGSPGGTAGGVKTTTITILGLSVISAIRGKWVLDIFGKRIPDRTLAKAAVTVTVAAVASILALTSLQLTQEIPTRAAAFEVVSALGTVGLSIGGTSALDGIGKIIIIFCMFFGRVGGLVLLMFLTSRSVQPVVGRPEEEVDVG